MPHSVITATGSHIPAKIIANSHFLKNEFYNPDGQKIAYPNKKIVKKLHQITGIRERRYAPDDLTASDLACFAAQEALKDKDRENLDYIIVAQNLGEIKAASYRIDMVPSMAARVKQKLGIKNPYTVAFDLTFGCPGWLQGVIMADQFIKSGDAQKILVIGAETLSRLIDPHDVDSMIYADGAGAAMVEAADGDAGVLSHVTRSDVIGHSHLLFQGNSYNPQDESGNLYIKMNGRKIYEYAVRTVPKVVKKSLDQSGLGLSQVKKVLIHQANEKMDEAILQRLLRMYNIQTPPANLMPMTISWLGNSSVATLPTLFDLILRGKMENHVLHSGDIILFASVGAGMNINSLVYKMP